MNDDTRKKEDYSLPAESSMSEADNPYQTKRTASEDVPESTLNEEPQSKPKYARTPEPKEPAEQAKIEKVEAMITETAPEKERSTAVVVISRIIFVLALLVFLTVGSVFLKNYIELRNNRLEAEKLAAQIKETVPTTINPDDIVGEDGILEKYRDAYNQNNDLVGWIKVPNTKIDHPVVQGPSNEYYMRKNFSKKYERRGSIFMDFRCDAKNFPKNTILYGHNYLDSTMFSDLEKYKDLDFYKSSPVIEFNTIYHNYKWKVFGVYLINAKEEDDNGYVFYYIHPFLSDNSFAEYVEEVRTRSIINMPVDVEKTDTMLTLSTCTRDMDLPGRGETNARCVVVARLVREGESDYVDVSAATKNPNPRYPQVWYTAHKLENPYVNGSQWEPRETD